jgi:hypothetical protein
VAGAAKEADLKAIAMAKGIGEIVCLAFGMEKSRVTVYRALKLLMCAACGETIGEAVLFTRRSLFGQGGTAYLAQVSEVRALQPPKYRQE